MCTGIQALAVLFGAISAACLYFVVNPASFTRFLQWKTTASLKQMGFQVTGSIRATAKTERFSRLLALFLAVYFLLMATVVWKAEQACSASRMRLGSPVARR